MRNLSNINYNIFRFFYQNNGPLNQNDSPGKIIMKWFSIIYFLNYLSRTYFWLQKNFNTIKNVPYINLSKFILILQHFPLHENRFLPKLKRTQNRYFHMLYPLKKITTTHHRQDADLCFDTISLTILSRPSSTPGSNIEREDPSWGRRGAWFVSRFVHYGLPTQKNAFH